MDIPSGFSPFPLDVLQAQTEQWRLPVRYLLAGDDAGREISADEVWRGVARSIVSPPTAVELSAELLAASEEDGFASLQDALTAGQLTSALGADETARLEAELRRRLAVAHAQARRRMMMCQLWYERLEEPTSVFRFDFRLDEARRHVDVPQREARALRSALETLAALADDLVTAERRELDALEKELEAREQLNGVDDELAASIRRALAAGSVLQARDLLRNSADGGGSRQVIPFRSAISNVAPTERLIAWLKPGNQPDRPWNFRALWGPREGDEAGQALLDAIDLVVGGRPDSTHVAFGRLLSALEQALGTSPAAAPPNVARLHGGRALVGHLRGLPGPGLYAFEDSAYEEGVPIVLPVSVANGAAGVSVNRFDVGEIDEDDFANADFVKDDLVKSPFLGDAALKETAVASAYYVSLGDIPAFGIDGRPLRLDWRQLLSLVGDRNRAENLRRFVGRQIAAEDAFPEATDRASTLALLIGRDEVPNQMLSVAPEALWIGPTGSGRTALLCRAEEQARRGGYRILRLTDVEEVDRAFSIFTASTTDQWLREIGATRLFITIDDLEKLEASRAHAGARAAALLQSIRDENDERIRAVGTAGPAFVAQTLATSWRWIPPLSFGETRELLLKLLDLSGGIADDRAVDHLAWYAGGYVRVLHFLLRGLRMHARASGDSWRVEVSQVEAFATRSDTQHTARTMLLQGVGLMPPLAKAVFAVVWDALIRHASPARRMEEGTIVEELQTWSARPVAASEVRTALLALEAAYVLDSRDGGWQLPDNGLGLLLADREIKTHADGYLEAFIAGAAEIPSV